MTRQVFALGLAAMVLCTAARADLLVNGSFEDGNFAPPGNATMTLVPGTTALQGWEVFNDNVAWIENGNPFGLTAKDGKRFLDLTDYQAGSPYGGIRQTIATIPGRNYRLSLYLGSATNQGRPSAVTVTAGGASTTFTGPATGTNNDWDPYSFDFVAMDAATTVSVVGVVGNHYIGLDDVSVEDLDAGDLDLQSLTLKSAEVAGCKSVIGTVTLTQPAPVGGVVVTLADTLAAATPPVSVKLLEGATAKTFTVKTVAVGTRQVGTVSATLGSTTLSQPLALRPMGMLLLTLAPTTVPGTQPVAGTAKLECKAGPGPVTVELASNNAAAQPVAASVVVPQGLQSTPFDVATSKVLVKTKATISATANGLAKTKTLYLTPAASVSPTILKFGSVAVGGTSAPLVATLSNKGAIAVTIDSIALTGTSAGWFAMSESCPASLAPGATCTISVTFKPLAAASRSAKVSIGNSATALPLSVTVNGTGVL